jgi:Tol biopolymer transport system component/DNA-binding winged helix-turn-helix (wHTH) protein
MRASHSGLGGSPLHLGPAAGAVRFAAFHLDPRSGELWHNSGTHQTLGDQPLAVLRALLERPGQLVTRTELRDRLWPGDTFVDFEHGLNAAVKRLRDALDDSADTPRFIETVPRRGYRFVAAIEHAGGQPTPHDIAAELVSKNTPWHPGARAIAGAIVGIVIVVALAAGAGWLASQHFGHPANGAVGRHLARLTYGPGIQEHATWSPDGRFIAYASDRGGNFDLWVHPTSGGEPIQITHSPAQDVEPDWSPDGRSIVFRRIEGKRGGLMVVSAFGGPERQLASFGARPTWSPDGAQVLFLSANVDLASPLQAPDVYVVDSNGGTPRRILKEFLNGMLAVMSVAWHPDGRRLSVLLRRPGGDIEFFTIVPGGAAAEIWAIKTAEGPPWSGAFPRQHVWDPSGTAVYLTFHSPSRVEIWRVVLDPRRHVSLTAERLTGDGMHADPAIAPDGKRLAFSSQNLSFRLWWFPRDGSRIDQHRPQSITSAGVQAGALDLASDDRHLAYSSLGPNGCELSVTDLETGTKRLIGGSEQIRQGTDLTYRLYPRWSRDNQKLAYSYSRYRTGLWGPYEVVLAVWRRDADVEQVLTTPVNRGFVHATDWSPDDRAVLATSNMMTPTISLGLWPVAAAPRAQTAVKTLVSDPEYNIFQGRFSPDNRWIAFTAIKIDQPTVSLLAVMPSSGGDKRQWRVLGDQDSWMDKPRWSPDGRFLYFIRRVGGYYNLWAQRFDTRAGTPIDAAFQFTSFNTPAFHIFPDMGWTQPSVSSTRMVLPMEESTGHISILDQIRR